MCHFITLIAPTADADAIRAVMARHGRKAHPVDNPSVRKVLRGGERQYLTTGAQCDCGTVLGAPRETPEAAEQKLADEAARLRRLAPADAEEPPSPGGARLHGRGRGHGLLAEVSQISPRASALGGAGG
ncbi:hypothetical protein [Caulobacter sp. 17J65-9]|uniref:hypothetical protein n=1 Tax=Caulobacter sp. 17J65-9 TaxID=2709382 RepID=UPI0013CB571B|nr:hypothetical protein [Caulobacter sp. 17J65-9]NEX94533.1 hypothetical protein [Caulobacter sp. 17J65-9]